MFGHEAGPKYEALVDSMYKSDILDRRERAAKKAAKKAAKI